MAMQASQVPAPLRERLGPDATSGLLDLLQDARDEWRSDVVSLCTERFERRLVEETSKLRVEMAQGFGQLRAEMAQGSAQLRAEMAQESAQLRGEMAQGSAQLRGEMAQGSAQIRAEMAHIREEMARGFSTERGELMKWMFLFWVGQVVAMAAIMSAMLRPLR
ncbi:MAG: hypothetical protein HYZ58_13140 [Acidobacteria bacterium]|nr:hypothetical protein [Acidobacteriota bacterium]